MNNLLMEVENEVAVVTINRPKSLNALNSETLAELDQCFGEIAERKDIRVVILTGSGTKAFVAGDVGSSILTIAVKQFQQRRKLFDLLAAASQKAHLLHKPSGSSMNFRMEPAIGFHQSFSGECFNHITFQQHVLLLKLFLQLVHSFSKCH